MSWAGCLVYLLSFILSINISIGDFQNFVLLIYVHLSFQGLREAEPHF